MDQPLVMHTAYRDFRDARRKALVTKLMDLARKRSSALFSFSDVRERLNVRGQRYLGHLVVPVDAIVGSEGRYTDFDRRFLPRTESLRHRWSSIDAAMIQDVTLPPVELYKLSEAYFVRDGNHRISVARRQGQTFVDAYVTELLVDVPIAPDLDASDLAMKEEYSDFLEWTNLHALRPSERIEFSALGGYLDLIRHINAHRYYLGLEHDREIPRDEAVASWYDHVYLPIVEAICAQNVLQHFPGRTEADLYRWIMDHRWYTQERTGSDPGPSSAASEYVALFGANALTRVLRSMFHNTFRSFRTAR